jgi:hypothetical protein
MSRNILRITSAAAVAAITLALTGCGSTNDNGDARGTSGATGRPSSTSDPTDRTVRHKLRIDPGDDHLPQPAQVVDTFDLAGSEWPADLAGAKALYGAMPATFGSRPGKHPRFFGSATGVAYGANVTAWSMAVDKTIPDAHAVLAVMFGMTMSCDKTTYQGTAEPEAGGRLPGAGADGNADLWWFSCQVNSAEGSRHFRAFAVGWTSSELGWLVVAPDEQTARGLVVEMGRRA